MNDRGKSVRRSLLASLVCLCLHPAWSDSADSAAAGPATRVTTTLAIEGQVVDPRVLSVEQVAALPSATTLEDIPLVGNDGALHRVLHGYRGVRLIDLVPESSIRAADHNARKRSYLVATASDGYVAVFSWAELYNSAIGGGVWVLFAKEGQPLGDEEGRFALLSSRDTHTGPRHVRWLKSLAVFQLPAP